MSVTADLRELYEAMILDHNQNPHNFDKRPQGANCHGYGFNPICQDEFSIYLVVEDGVVMDVGIEGVGCAISTASASMMSDAIMGKTVAEIEQLFESMRQLLSQDQPDPGIEQQVGKLRVLAGVRQYPMRVKCATLAWHTMHAALHGIQDTVSTEQTLGQPSHIASDATGTG